MIVFSCIIPASKKDAESQNLKDLIASIKAQDFPQDQIEILVVTEGDSEQAKAIGIRRATGKICVMLCADNYFVDKFCFASVYETLKQVPNTMAVYGRYYALRQEDNSLNRYFSLIGGNDPICWFIGKNDRRAYDDETDALFEVLYFKDRPIPSLGCNGTFINRLAWIENADLDHYYPMDCAVDVIKKVPAFWVRRNVADIWHRTSEKLIPFLIKRYKYARDLYCDRDDRRWRMVDGTQDYWRLAGFVFCTLTIIPLLFVSLRGFRKIRDFAWFYHIPVCWGFLITYGILACRNILKSRSSFLRGNVQTVSKSA